MRKLAVLLAVLVLLAAAAFYAATNLNDYLRDNREWLAQQATAAIGRPVRFDDIGVSFRGGLGAQLSGVSIGDDPAFSRDDFVRVENVDVVVKILPALRGSYELRRIVLEAPQINVIREARGFNFESIGAASSAAAVKEAPAPQVEPGGDDASSELARQLLVSLLNAENGRIRCVDRTTPKAAELVIDRLDVSASDLSLDRPVSIEAAAAILGSAEQNLRVDGSIGPLGDPDRALGIANVYAPEHRTINTANASALAERARNAGSVFVGPWTPESLGDYCSGTNHVLPTYGWARSHGALGVGDFMRRMTIQQASREALALVGPTAEKLAAVEGLEAHRMAVRCRLEKVSA